MAGAIAGSAVTWRGWNVLIDIRREGMRLVVGEPVSGRCLSGDVWNEDMNGGFYIYT